MVFMGTKKYPNENEFSSFLSNTGGSSNAFTDNEETCFMFDVQNQNLKPALDIFAQFFVSPLFTSTATGRELKAVDSEHRKNVMSDSWRMDQIERNTSNSKHAYASFGTGTIDTLDTVPKSKGIQVRDMLIEFHDLFYVTKQNMALVLLGREDVTTLRLWIEEMFALVPTNPKEHCTMKSMFARSRELPIYLNGTNEIVYVEPIKDARSIDICWELDSYDQVYWKDPLEYLSHLFGHEGEGSILHHLKKVGLATGLSAGVSAACTDFSIFKISIECTDLGIQPAGEEEIRNVVFEFAELLLNQGPVLRIFLEMQQLQEIKFRFQSKPDTYSFCSSAAGALRRYPAKHVLTGDHVVREYDADLIAGALAKLTPDRARVYVQHKRVSTLVNVPSLWKVEPWYGSKYAVVRKDFTQERLIARTKTDVCLPHPNPFIPRDFAMTTLKKSSNPEMIRRPPSKAAGTPPNLHVWYKRDETFMVPKAILRVSLHLPNVYTSPRASVLAELSSHVANDVLNAFAYDAQVAGLSYVWTNSIRGMSLVVSGYKDKMTVLLDRVLSTVTDINTYREANVFHRQLDKYTRQLRNFKKENPYQIALYESSVLLNIPRWNFSEKLATIEAKPVQIEELVDFVKHYVLAGATRMVCLVGGNVTRDSSITLCESIWSRLSFEKSVYRSYRPRVLALPRAHTTFLRIPAQSEENVNCALEFVAQIGPESTIPRLHAMLSLLIMIAEEPCFHELRTIKQLGYIVSLGTRRETGGIRALRIVVQSSAFDLDSVWGFVHDFVSKTMRSEIESTSAVDYAKLVETCAIKKLQKDITLGEEMARWWDEIDEESFFFNRAQQLAQEIRSVTKTEMLHFYDVYLRPSSMEKRWLVCGVDAAVVSEEKVLPPVAVGVLSKATMDLVELGIKLSGDEQARLIHLTPEQVPAFRDSAALWEKSYL